MVLHHPYPIARPRVVNRVALFRDPHERLLSRYYYDVVQGKTKRGALKGGREGSRDEGDLGATAHKRAEALEPADGSWLSAVEIGKFMHQHHRCQVQKCTCWLIDCL
jgi:hypothetical protein